MKNFLQNKADIARSNSICSHQKTSKNQINYRLNKVNIWVGVLPASLLNVLSIIFRCSRPISVFTCGICSASIKIEINVINFIEDSELQN